LHALNYEDFEKDGIDYRNTTYYKWNKALIANLCKVSRRDLVIFSHTRLCCGQQWTYTWSECGHDDLGAWTIIADSHFLLLYTKDWCCWPFL